MYMSSNANHKQMRRKQKKYFVCEPFMGISSLDVLARLIICATYLKTEAGNTLERKKAFKSDSIDVVWVKNPASI